MSTGSMSCKTHFLRLRDNQLSAVCGPVHGVRVWVWVEREETPINACNCVTHTTKTHSYNFCMKFGCLEPM